ncbi:Fic family protein [Streptomyces sp. KR80]|uniref:Fic family protein n=1 Tax=Streptomyces sp. KR80 TaxID=3457426 RepID=UPI003FD256BA
MLQSLALNPPFVDGNKRTAWLCTVVFLDANRAEMVDVDQDRAYDLVIDIASGKTEEVAVIAEALRELRRELSQS